MVISSSSSSSSVVMKVAPYGCMIIVQMISASYIILSQIILVQGISSPVFLFYQFILGTIFMAFLSLIFESMRISADMTPLTRRSRLGAIVSCISQKAAAAPLRLGYQYLTTLLNGLNFVFLIIYRKSRPPLTRTILCWIFLMALLGVTFMQNMLAACLYFVSSTIVAAVLNMIPIFTYTLSIITKQEKLELNTLWGKGKLFGTLISVSGALTLVLWHQSSTLQTSTSFGYWVLGLVMVIAGVFALSSWILLLRPMTNLYPAEFSLTAMMLFFAMLQTGLIAAITSHESWQWELKWDLELLNIFFGGLLNGAVSNLFMTWCSTVKGPVFVASFPPLGLVFTTILQTTFLHSSLKLGSIVGSIMIMVGLYVYLWSKSREEVAVISSIDDGDDDHYEAIAVQSPLVC